MSINSTTLIPLSLCNALPQATQDTPKMSEVLPDPKQKPSLPFTSRPVDNASQLTSLLNDRVVSGTSTRLKRAAYGTSLAPGTFHPSNYKNINLCFNGHSPYICFSPEEAERQLRYQEAKAAQQAQQMTHTGNTTINSATLQLGNGGNTGSILDNLANNNDLVFNPSNAVIFSETGARMILTGDNTYSDSSTISTGPLQVDEEPTGSISDNLANNSDLVFNHPATLDLEGFNRTTEALTGSGTVTNSGTSLATPNIGNTNSEIFEGSTFVNYGKLQGTTNDFSDSVKIENEATLDIGGLGFNTGSIATNNEAANATGFFWGYIQDGNGTTDLIKVGTGKNIYSGSTIHNQGVLLVQEAGITFISNSDVTVTNEPDWIWEGLAALLEIPFKLTESIVERLTRFSTRISSR